MRNAKISFPRGSGPSRRNFLRGTGVCLALPWLEALAPLAARGQSSAAPRRFLPIYFPNGVAHDQWTLKGQGSNWQLSPILQPFGDLKSKMIAFSNLENYTAMEQFQGNTEPWSVQPSHARCTAAYLTCADSDSLREELNADFANGVSVDQVLAQSLNSATVFESLQVGLGTSEYSSLDARHESYSRSISWKAATEPLYKEVNPQAVFDRLVGAFGVDGPDMPTSAEATRRRVLRTSVLDSVADNTQHVQSRLGARDRERLDQYLTSMREVEQNISALPNVCPLPPRPEFVASHGLANGTDGYDRAVHFDTMNELIVAALSCDATRVISYMLDDARSDFSYDHLTERVFDEAGSVPGKNSRVLGSFHGFQNAGESNPGFATINWWLSDRVADLCRRMDAIDEGGVSLLDNSVVLYGSGMHGANHLCSELPIVLIGGGGGRIKTDQHIAFEARPNERPLRDLYYTLLNEVFQVGVSSFGNSALGVENRLVSEMLV